MAGQERHDGKEFQVQSPFCLIITLQLSHFTDNKQRPREAEHFLHSLVSGRGIQDLSQPCAFKPSAFKTSDLSG